MGALPIKIEPAGDSVVVTSSADGQTGTPVTHGEAARAALPDYLPARMVNEFAYCPRLFFYEWVEGLFQESSDTVEGAIQHRRGLRGCRADRGNQSEKGSAAKVHTHRLTADLLSINATFFHH